MDNVEKVFNLGQNYKNKGNYSSALNNFLVACEQNPRFAESWHCAGHMAKLLNQPDNSQKYLAKAISLYDLEDKEDCFWIGAAYALLEDKAKSLEFLQKAIELDNFENNYRIEASKEEGYQVFYNDSDFKQITTELNDGEIENQYHAYQHKIFLKNEVKFKEVSVDQFKFYLATALHSNLLIKSAELNQMIANDDKKRTLAQYLTDNFYKPQLDEQKDIIGLTTHADMWQPSILEIIAKYIKNTGEIILKDDVGKYWKIEFKENKVKYYRQI